MNPKTRDKMESSLVSICIPVYNGAEYIEETLRSVSAQTYTQMEIVVVDNQSTDNTMEILRNYPDKRVKIFQNETNIGLIANWNMVMRKASGKYIKILPADDTIYPTCVEKQVAVFEKDPQKHIAMVCCRKHLINESGKIILSRGFAKKEMEVNGFDAISKNVRSGGNIIGEGAPTMFRKEILEKTGYIETDIGLCTDLDMWFRILLHGNLYVLPEILATFRVCKSSNSVVIAEKQKNDYIQFITQVYHKKVYKISGTSFLIGKVKASILTVAKKIVYRYFL